MMGLRGPAPKPTALRVYEGNPAKRPLPEREPMFEPGIPRPPKHISRPARKVWNELVEEMATTGVLCKADRRALWQLSEDEAMLSACYVGMWQLVKQLEERANSEGRPLAGGAVFQLLNQSSGRLAMAQIRRLARQVIVERREFGLTPSARTRIEVSGLLEGGIDPIELKLCGRIPA